MLNGGESAFFGKRDFAEHDTFLEVLIASSSLPFISSPTLLNNTPYLDGGIAVPIPLAQARTDGYQRQVVILLQAPEYRKTAFKFKWLAQRVYRRYLKVAAAIVARHQVYNDALADLAVAQAAGIYLLEQTLHRRFSLSFCIPLYISDPIMLLPKSIFYLFNNLISLMLNLLNCSASIG